ncbi:MAG: hypothetical protein ACOX17_00085 [Christensenellales bacterium]|jgi:hypothetical protein
MKKVSEGDPRFDMNRPPLPITAAGSLRQKLAGLGFRLDRVRWSGMAELREPCLVLVNSPSPLVFRAMAALIFPHPLYFAAPLEFFIGREEMLRETGAIGVRRYTQDIRLIRHLSRAVGEFCRPVAVSPDSGCSLYGREETVSSSWGRVARMLGVPVVAVCFDGLYLRRPIWRERSVSCPVFARATEIITREEVARLSPDEMTRRIRLALRYDDFAWQEENHIQLRSPRRAEGLHRVLYKCPVCGEERMNSRGDTLRCIACGKRWELTPSGRLEAETGETMFSRVTDWGDWQAAMLRQAPDSLSLEVPVRVAGMTGSAGFGPEVPAQFVLGTEGLMIEGELGEEQTVLYWEAASLRGVYVSYAGERQQIQISTLTDTYRVTLPASLPAAKVSQAVNVLYRMRKEKNREAAALFESPQI